MGGSFDIARIMAIFFVIIGPHYAGPLLYKWGAIPTSTWLVANAYDSFAFIGVPLFVMLSGSLLLPKSEATSIFFKKRFFKIVLPFVIWTVIYILWRMLYKHESLSVGVWIHQVATGQIYYHLWFLYMILGLYLVTPFLRSFVAGMKPQDMLRLSSLWLLSYALLPVLRAIANQILSVDVPLPLGSVGSGLWLLATALCGVVFLVITWPGLGRSFFLLALGLIPMVWGMAIYYYDINMSPSVGPGYTWLVASFLGYYVFGSIVTKYQWRKMALWAGLVLGSLSTGAITYIATMGKSETNFILYDYGSISVLLTAVSVFCLAESYFGDWTPSNRMKCIIRRLAEASFGVYLVHPIFLELFRDGAFGFRLDAVSFAPILAIPVSAVAVYAVSTLFTLVALRIPIVKHIV